MRTRPEKARRKVGFRSYDEDEEYWGTDILGVGSIMDLSPMREDETERVGLFRKRVVKKKNPTFGFGRVLDDG